MLTGCGVKVEGPDEIKVVHSINVDNLMPYITAYCELANTTPLDVTLCAQAEMGKIIRNFQ